MDTEKQLTGKNNAKPAKSNKTKASLNMFETANDIKPKSNKRSASSNKRKANKKQKYCWWAAPAITLCIIVIVFIGMMGFREYRAYASFQQEIDSVLNEEFYQGVCVDSYEMTGFNLASALDTFGSRVESGYSQRSLFFSISDDNGFLISAEELGYTSDYREVIERAWNYGRSGSLEERYRSVSSVSSTKINYKVNRTLYDPQKLRAVTDNVAETFTSDAKNASVKSFDFGTRTFVFSESQAGSYVDADKLYEEACRVLENGGGVINVNVITIAPKDEDSDISQRYGMITQAVTNASSSSNNRLINLNLACKAINGTVVKPGEVFSFNETVGQRTKARGYTEAPVYSNGEVDTDIGGGVCQVSTTLWNAAMKANCEIVERHEHSRPVSYVDKGKDATVSWGIQDMKFENTTDHDLYIVAYLREDKRVIVEIYGELFQDGSYIKIEAKTTRRIAPGDPVRVLNPALKRGEEVVVSEARTGYKAEAYRVYYDANDNEIGRELLCTSYYKEAAAKVEYGA